MYLKGPRRAQKWQLPLSKSLGCDIISKGGRVWSGEESSWFLYQDEAGPGDLRKGKEGDREARGEKRMERGMEKSQEGETGEKSDEERAKRRQGQGGHKLRRIWM